MGNPPISAIPKIGESPNSGNPQIWGFPKFGDSPNLGIPQIGESPNWGHGFPNPPNRPILELPEIWDPNSYNLGIFKIVHLGIIPGFPQIGDSNFGKKIDQIGRKCGNLSFEWELLFGRRCPGVLLIVGREQEFLVEIRMFVKGAIAPLKALRALLS